MTTLRAGNLRHHLRLDRYVETGTGDRGQPVGDWHPVAASLAADVVSLSGRQAEIARQLVATATHTITIRYRPGVLPGQRLTGTSGQFAGREFVVGHVGDGDGRKHFLTLTTTEQVTGATE